MDGLRRGRARPDLGASVAHRAATAVADGARTPAGHAARRGDVPGGHGARGPSALRGAVRGGRDHGRRRGGGGMAWEAIVRAAPGDLEGNAEGLRLAYKP
eukprot:5931262-Prymnesium_polylepis.1